MEPIKTEMWRAIGNDTVVLNMYKDEDGYAVVHAQVVTFGMCQDNDMDLFSMSYGRQEDADHFFRTCVESFDRIYDEVGNEVGEEDE